MSATTSRSDAAVIIPMYNECENAAAIIDAVLALRYHSISLSSTIIRPTAPPIVKQKIAQYPGRVDIIERAGKLGLGTAYIEGFRHCLEKDYEFICEMDADFSHNPQDLIRLRQAAIDDNADVAIGSRYVTGVNVVNWPMGRVLMSYYASKYVRLITRMPVHDTTAVCMLPPRGTQDNAARQNQIQGLCFSDRDEVHSLQIWIQDCRGAHHFCQPSARHKQDEQRHFRRGCVRCDTFEMEQSVQKISAINAPC